MRDRVEAAVLDAHDRLCAALCGHVASEIVEQFCLDDVDLWGPEPADVAHGPADLLTLATSLVKRPHRPRFEWSDRSVLAADDVAWVSAIGKIVLGGDALIEHRPYQMCGVLLRVGRHWRWRLLEAGEETPGGLEPGPDGARR